MTGSTLALLIGVLTTGLFSGLMAAVVFLFQKILKGLTGQEFTQVMQRFLPWGRTAPVNHILVLVSVLAPALALVLGHDDVGGLAFLLTLAGMLVFLAGVLLLSRFGVERVYDTIMGWKAQAPPAEWSQVRERYFRINRLRIASSWVAFLLLLTALALPEGSGA